MDGKKYTIEELEERYEECMKQGESLLRQIEAKKKEEERELAKIKDARKKEIDMAIESVKELLAAWAKDYGTYIFEHKDENWNEENFYRSYLYHLWF